MVDSNLSLSQRYEQFVAANPLYKSMPVSTVGSIMLNQNLITKQELSELSQSLFTKKEKTFDWQNFNGYNSMGLNLSANESKSSAPKNYVEKPKTYHPRLTFLELTPKGNVDLDQFSLTSLKSKYDSKNYNIFENEQGTIKVTKKDGSPVLSVGGGYWGDEILVRLVDGKNEQTLVIKDGKLNEYTIKENKQGVEISATYSGDKNLPVSRHETYQNGDRKTINYDKNTGKIEFEDYWKKDGCTPERFVKYSNGKPYKKANGYMDKNPEYVLVNDLKDDIYAKTKLGLPTTRNTISENVLKRINSENVLETLEQYEKLTGKNLLQDIDDEIGLPKKLRNRLINHIEALYCKNAPEKESGKYLAKKLFDDIDGLGSGKLADHVKMITPRNLKYVLTEYKKITQDSFYKQEHNIFKILNTLDFLPIDKYNTSETVAEKLAPIEGLLTAIAGEWGLNQKERERIIKQIINVALEEKAPEVKARIEKDIAAHPNDTHKVEIDLYRAENAKGGDLRNPELKKQQIETSKNKTFSGQIKQNLTGDCWLLAGLNAIIAKPKMLKELEKLVKIDSKTGDYIVQLKGANTSYRVTKADLESYNTLASGSEKVNAIEIAMDKYIRDEAYQNKDNIHMIDEEFGYIDDVTIDSNHSGFLWRTLFGINEKLWNIPKIDPLIEDFNNPDRAYEMSLSTSERVILSGIAKSEKEENCDIHSRHAYSIIGSDDENIYMLNPWDSDNKITISRENFAALGTHIEFYEIPKA